MRYRNGLSTAAAAAIVLVASVPGCETSSRTSIRVYEYREDVPVQRVPDREDDSEYHMESPGEMIAPGTMVPDP